MTPGGSRNLTGHTIRIGRRIASRKTGTARRSAPGWDAGEACERHIGTRRRLVGRPLTPVVRSGGTMHVGNRMRICVRSVYRLSSLLAWSSICGFATGLLLAALMRAGQPIFLSRPFLFEALALAIPIPLAIWFSCLCQRVSRVYLAGHVYGSCYLAGSLLTAQQWVPGAGAGASALDVLLLAGGIVVVGFPFGCANLALWALNRLLFFRVVEQDGSLCSKCAYIIHDPSSSLQCPECGAPLRKREPQGNIGRYAHWVAVVLMCAMVSSWAIYLFVTQHSPATEFLSALDGEAAFGGAIVAGPWANDAIGTYLFIPGDTRVLMIFYDPSPPAGFPTMQIRVGTLAKTPLGQVIPTDGTPIVHCDLDASQAEDILLRGVPDSLVERLLQRSRVAWGSPAATPVVPIEVPFDNGSSP